MQISFWLFSGGLHFLADWGSVAVMDSNSIFLKLTSSWSSVWDEHCICNGTVLLRQLRCICLKARVLEGSHAMQPNWPCRLQTCKSQLADWGQLCRWMSDFCILTCAEYQLHAQSIAATIMRQMRSLLKLACPLDRCQFLLFKTCTDETLRWRLNWEPSLATIWNAQKIRKEGAVSQQDQTRFPARHIIIPCLDPLLPVN